MIDCDMNPAAVGNDPERAGRTGLIYLIIALLFFLGTFRKLSNVDDLKKKDRLRINR